MRQTPPSPRVAPSFLHLDTAAGGLLPLVAATRELVGGARSLVLRLALAEGLRVLARRTSAGDRSPLLARTRAYYGHTTWVHRQKERSRHQGIGRHVYR